MTLAAPRGHRPAIMAAARAASSATTVVLPVIGDAATVRLPVVSTDPLDELVERVRPVVRHAVDALQVAATLEADGLTDRAARVEYGYTDVFALADEVYRRLSPGAPAVRPSPPAGSGSAAARDISHGALYLLPATLFPAVLAVVGPGPLVLAIVVAGGFGWTWAGGAGWLAYRRLGAGDPAGAADVLRASVALGMPLAGLLGVVLVFAAGGEPLLAVLCLGQLAYQLASLLLVFYRREGLLAGAMAPAAVAGCTYVVAGRPVLPWVLAIGAASVVAALALGLRATAAPRAAVDGSGGLRSAAAAVRADPRGLGWVTGYTALSAAYLLQAQAVYLRGPVDIAVAAGPLLAGMGVVEWRARRFAEHARALLTRVRYPREFARRLWPALAGGVLACVGTVALLAVPLLAGLWQAGRLSPAGVLMAAAHAVLAGAYFLGFLLAGQGRYTALCLALVAAVTLHVAGAAAAGASGDPLVDTGFFLGSAVLLQVLCAVFLTQTAVRVWGFR